MQVKTFMSSYHPGMDGGYSIKWDPQFDIPLYGILASLAEFTMAQAHYLHITSAVLTVNADVVGSLRDPLGEVQVAVSYRINDIPATFSTVVHFFAADIETLEPYVPAPIPC